MKAKRICLVSPGHIASNPRLVKEADALHEAGFAVRVVAGNVTPSVRPLDETILKRASWPIVKVGSGPRPAYLARRLRQEFAKCAFAYGATGVPFALWAHSSSAGILATAAAAEPADLYIGHYLEGLSAAAWAARRHGAKLGFDAEDDHVGELTKISKNQLDIAIRRRIEGEFLRRCEHLTASSPGIARAYRERYGVTMTSILNVFPLSQASPDPPAGRHGRALSIYWFSQTIGPGRGLEPFIKAMGRTRSRVTLSIRGSDFLGYSAYLKSLAAEVGVADAISFLPSEPPELMARFAATHDVGLASELSTPPNHAICLSNKIFIYLLAGIPILMSNTPAQTELAGELGHAARVIDLDDRESTALAIDAWAMDAATLTAAKYRALELAKTRFNWDFEKVAFLQSIEQTLQ